MGEMLETPEWLNYHHLRNFWMIARHRSMTRAAEALWAEGVHWLDLGSVDSERAPGLARFKLGTGAALKRLGSTCLVLP